MFVHMIGIQQNKSVFSLLISELPIFPPDTMTGRTTMNGGFPNERGISFAFLEYNLVPRLHFFLSP